MTIDPFIGIWIGLAATVVTGFVGAWFAGVFDRPRGKKTLDVLAE